MLGKHRLDRLRPAHLDAFYSELARQGLAPNTVLQIHRIVSRSLKIAWKRGQAPVNVASMVDAPVGEDVDIEPLSSAEARQILTTAQSRRNGARWSVALVLGIRQSEAIGLRWQFVNLDVGTIEVGWQLRQRHYQHGCDDPVGCSARYHRVRCPPRCPVPRHRLDCVPECTKRGHACPTVKRPCRPGCLGHGRECPQRTGGDWYFSRRKGVKAGRGTAKLTLALPKPLAAQLQDHYRRQDAERAAAGPAWDDWDLVFCTPNGSPIDSRKDWADWRGLLREAGVREARVHDARHTAATCSWSRTSISASSSRSSATPRSARPSATPT